MNDNIQYFVSSVHSIHNIAVVPVKVGNTDGRLIRVERVDNGASFFTNTDYLFDTPSAALNYLKQSIIEFKAEMDYCLSKAIAQVEAMNAKNKE